MIEHNIILNMKQPGALETGIELTQGDYGQVAFYIRVKDDNTYITNATKATMVFNLSDGAIVSGSATISAGTYSYVFKGNELQTPGKVSAMITLEFSDGRVSSCGYTFEVRYNPLYDRRIPAGVYISELENIVQQAQGQIDYLNQLIQILQGDVGGTVLTRANLVNNFLATIAGVSALDAVAGKTIWDKAVEAHNIANAAKDTADKVNSDIGAIAFVASSGKPTSGYTVSDDSYVRRSAVGQVDLFCDVTAGTLQNKWHTVAFIPEGYRPVPFSCVQCIVFDSNDVPANLRCFVYADGNIKVFNHLAEGNYKLRIFGSYFVPK